MIDRFEGEYRFLSNFWPCNIVFEGDAYPSVEHAYQAAKTVILGEREAIRRANTAGQAKRLGRYVKMRPDWDEVKVSVMYDLVKQKFDDKGLKRRLLATKPNELIEGNRWGDRFWGMCNGTGRNELGKILMRVRDEL